LTLFGGRMLVLTMVFWGAAMAVLAYFLVQEFSGLKKAVKAKVGAPSDWTIAQTHTAPLRIVSTHRMGSSLCVVMGVNPLLRPPPLAHHIISAGSLAPDPLPPSPPLAPDTTDLPAPAISPLSRHPSQGASFHSLQNIRPLGSIGVGAGGQRAGGGEGLGQGSAAWGQGLTLVPISVHLELLCPPYNPT